MKELSEYTDEQLLSELISRNKPSKAPSKISLASTALESIIGIGSDNTAFIILHDDDVIALSGMVVASMEDYADNGNVTR